MGHGTRMLAFARAAALPALPPASLLLSSLPSPAFVCPSLPAEPGSATSSPSKAGSLVPLLRSAPSARSALLKFPSGVSAVSSHDNPVFEDAGEQGLWASAATQQSVLPQHVGSWELQSQLVTQQAVAQAQAAAAAAAAAQQQLQQQAAEEEDGWRPDVLAMMERKGATGGWAG